MNWGVTPSPKVPDSWTPTDINALVSCGLRTGFDHDGTFKSKFRKDTTFSITGTAAHELTRLAWTHHFDGVADSDLKTRLFEEWERLIHDGFVKLSEQWLPAVVPEPMHWPFYSITRQRTLKRVLDEILNREARGQGDDSGMVRVERWISDPTTGLGGIPDRVVLTGEGFYVLDIKTGLSVDSITDSHRRQLLIYAHLVGTTTEEPLRGIGIVSAGGKTFWEAAGSDDVKRAVEDVLHLISRFREAVNSRILGDLAAPSPENCRYCPYKGICRSYWESGGEDWLDQRGVAGRVISVLNPVAFSVEQAYPTEGAKQVVGVSNTAHAITEGDFVSVVDGFRRGNSLRGDWNTRVQILDVGQPL